MKRLHFLDSFFYPRNVAIVGASRNPLAVTYNLVVNLVKLGFSGEIYPVNPSADEICGIKAYPTLNDIDADVDLVVSVVPANVTMGIVNDCIKKKVKIILFVTGGFSEIGEEGSRVQDEIAYLLKQNGIRAIGPNALSPINSANNLAINFHPLEELPRGGLSCIFQSGMYEYRISWVFSDFHLGISKLVDLGNKMDVTEVDVLEYLSEDPDTKIIGIHLEAVKGDGRELMWLLKSTSKKKPVIVLKSGRTTAGAKAAASHTGSLARGSDAIFDTALKQAGVIRARTLEDMLDFAKAFEFQNLPNGRRMMVISSSGGDGVVVTDLCQQADFLMAKPSQSTFDKVKAIFPPWEIPLNPFDLGVCFHFHNPIEVYDVFIRSVLDDDNVDCLVVEIPPIEIMLKPEEFCYEAFVLAKEKGKSIAVWRPAINGSEDKLAERLESNGVPVYPSAIRAIEALSAIYRYKTMHQDDD